MSKELVRPRDYSKAQSILLDENFVLNDAQRAELKALYEGDSTHFKTGSIITGKVISATTDGVLVDINYKSDGLIPLYEFTEHEIKRLVPNSPIEVIIDELENYEGNVILSYEKAKALKAWDAIMKMYEAGKPVEGVVTHKVKGGLSVDIGISAFLPGSQVDTQRVADFDQYVGQTITAYIIKVNPKRGNVIISRRKYLNEQRSEVRKKILDTLEVGQVIQGIVKNITNYGAFIDIGGVDGLLHITDMSWGRVAHPSEMLKIGDTITVQVLSFDKTNEKISLGLKQLEGNPWEHLSTEVQQGTKVKGAITSITDYGLFVEIAKGVEGLIRTSEISWTDRYEDLNDLNKSFKVGDEIEAVVISLDKENRRMYLSIKQLEKSPWDAMFDEFQVGQRVKGKVSNITDFGVFVQLAPGVDGLVYISDFSWTEHIKHPGDLYKKGDDVEAVITEINKPKKKISLSVKDLSANPWENLEGNYPVGSLIEGEVTKITDFGAFVKLASGIEGLVRAADLGYTKVDDVLKVGQKGEFRVLKVNQEEHKLNLGLKDEIETRRPQKAERAERGERSERAERGDRGDRGERGERNERPERGAPRSKRGGGEATASPAQKGKSMLQLELEKHAARYNDEE